MTSPFFGNSARFPFLQGARQGGIAVAFNSPIGGLLFTVEEGASFYSRSSFWRPEPPSPPLLGLEWFSIAQASPDRKDEGLAK